MPVKMDHLLQRSNAFTFTNIINLLLNGFNFVSKKLTKIICKQMWIMVIRQGTGKK